MKYHEALALACYSLGQLQQNTETWPVQVNFLTDIDGRLLDVTADGDDDTEVDTMDYDVSLEEFIKAFDKEWKKHINWPSVAGKYHFKGSTFPVHLSNGILYGVNSGQYGYRNCCSNDRIEAF